MTQSETKNTSPAHILYQPIWKKASLDIGLRIIGATACYWIGQGMGELADHVSFVNSFVPNTINYFSNIDVMGNLNGVCGLVGMVFGAMRAGVKTQLFEMNVPEFVRKRRGDYTEGQKDYTERITELNLGFFSNKFKEGIF